MYDVLGKANSDGMESLLASWQIPPWGFVESIWAVWNW